MLLSVFVLMVSVCRLMQLRVNRLLREYYFFNREVMASSTVLHQQVDLREAAFETKKAV